MTTSKIVAAVGAAAVFLASPAMADTLFQNPGIGPGIGTQWCDPCSSGNTGYQVWDSFTLSNQSTLTSFRWVGLLSDNFSQNVQIEINTSPYGQPGYISPVTEFAPPAGPTVVDIFSAMYGDSDIAKSPTGNQSSFRTVSLPDVVLGPGTYWISVHGTSITAQQTWLGVTEPNGDNSLIQYGPDPNAPQVIIPRDQDAVFFLFGKVSPVPEPSTWAMMLIGFIGVGFLAHRRRNALRVA
jgi:hypothetical protein